MEHDSAPSKLAGKSNIRMKRRTLHTALILAIGLILGTTTPVKANQAVCITVYYETFGGPPQYIQNNNCYGPAGWFPRTGAGPSCPVQSNPLTVCYAVTVSIPI